MNDDKKRLDNGNHSTVNLTRIQHYNSFVQEDGPA